jgi:hypothetical protein
MTRSCPVLKRQLFFGVVIVLAHTTATWSQVGTMPATEQQAIVASPESLAAWQYNWTPDDEALLDKIEHGCFLYFWKEVGHPACLARDKSSDTICSMAAVGFQLSSLPIGIERGWITRAEGEQRALSILRALFNRDDNKKNGIYFHFLDEDSGGQSDYKNTKYPYELQASTVDNALFEAGVITASSYFGGEVAKLADKIVRDANWRAFEAEPDGYINFGWHCETNRGLDGPGKMTPMDWQWASDEERLIYFLAVGAPDEDYAVSPKAYYRLKRQIKRHDDMPPYVVSWNGSLFTYFFSHCWIDYRHFAADDPKEFDADEPAVDWFENSRRAALTQRQRCIELSHEFPTMSENRWGLAPCEFRNDYYVHEVRPSVHDKDEWYNGVVPPYGAGSAIMFTPAESLAALREYKSLTGPDGKPLAWRDPDQGGFAFVDSFSLTPPYGQEDNLGIDEGPMLLAIENVRTGLIWRLFMQHDVARRAAERLQLKTR